MCVYDGETTKMILIILHVLGEIAVPEEYERGGIFVCTFRGRSQFIVPKHATLGNIFVAR